MTADDFSAPLGQQPTKRRRRFPIAVPQAVAGALALFVGVFILWAIFADDPYGGEPTAAVPVDLRSAATAKKPALPDAPKAAEASADGRDSAAPASGPPSQRAPADAKTVTIINGKTGEREQVTIPATGEGTAATSEAVDQKFAEMTSHGPVPKIAADGTRPAEAYARPVKPLPGKPEAPRIALIVSGLGVSAGATADSIAKLPGPVTLGFMPYGGDVERFVARARASDHETLLQVPMEPFNYPDNDPGPQTLLTSLTPEQNIERLHWLMSRLQGYVGIVGAMGARFTASEQSFVPVLREIAKRGLIYVDDGANPRSIAGRVAGADNLPFAKADVILDAVPTAGEIDRALGRLEMAARERGAAVGISSALPVSIKRIAEWAKGAENRGILLVPISAIAVKTKQS